jgi:hypothetical protein
MFCHPMSELYVCRAAMYVALLLEDDGGIQRHKELY